MTKGFPIFALAAGVLLASRAMIFGQTGETLGPLPQAVSDHDRQHSAFQMLGTDELVFFNADHSPVGANASFVYGMERGGGFMMAPGRTSRKTNVVPRDGLIIAIRDGPGARARLLPFCAPRNGDRADRIDRRLVRRTLRASVDAWDASDGVTWKHYTPYWPMPDIATATAEERKRFVLPATWMAFEVDNTAGTAEKSVLFSLRGGSPVRTSWGDCDGYVIDGKHALALDRREGAAVSAAIALAQFGVADAGSAFVVTVPSGERRSFTVIVAHYDGAMVSNLDEGRYYYTAFFGSLGDVVRFAAPGLAAARRRSEALRDEVARDGLNEYRQFLIGHALDSYMFNTLLLRTRSGRPIWAVIEGEYGYINTLDLTVDQAPFELRMHPWTVRAELDLFSSRYAYHDRIRSSDSDVAHPGGLCFTHDMGLGARFWPPGEQAYSHPMAQEELQNWIVCAGLYWKSTRDRAWLARDAGIFIQCLASMQIRDDLVPAKRDGLTSLTTYSRSGADEPIRQDNSLKPGVVEYRPELTTYDALDNALRLPTNNLYIAVKSFASYLALASIFDELGDAPHASACRAAAAMTARSIVSHWDPSRRSFPAVFTGSGETRIIPAVEPLVYPYLMGLRREIAFDGPYAQLIRLLREHLDTVLRPGICLDAKTGAWKLSSGSDNTWQSKVYLAQFVADKVLGLGGERVSGRVDAVHASFQVLGAPAVAWSDQLWSYDGVAEGSRHYPRGVTSFLWLEK